MSNKIIKCISGTLGIISLLFILTTLIIDVNGGDSVKTCQSNQPPIKKGIQDRIKTLLHEDSGESIDLTKSIEWDIKYCDGINRVITYSIKVPVTQGKKTEKYKYLAYVQTNKIIDVRSMKQIEAEKKKLKKMGKSKLTNAADLSPSMLDDIKDRIVHILSSALRTKVIPKHFLKTKLIWYGEEINQIVYYVKYQTIIKEKMQDNEFRVEVRYRNGNQEITEVKSMFNISLEH